MSNCHIIFDCSMHSHRGRMGTSNFQYWWYSPHWWKTDSCESDGIDCAKELQEAQKHCDEVERNNDYGSGLSHNGRNYAECVRGRISEECIEGNPVDYGPYPKKDWRK